VETSRGRPSQQLIRFYFPPSIAAAFPQEARRFRLVGAFSSEIKRLASSKRAKTKRAPVLIPSETKNRPGTYLNLPGSGCDQVQAPILGGKFIFGDPIL
jgi:hypothetical protein